MLMTKLADGQITVGDAMKFKDIADVIAGYKVQYETTKAAIINFKSLFTPDVATDLDDLFNELHTHNDEEGKKREEFLLEYLFRDEEEKALIDKVSNQPNIKYEVLGKYALTPSAVVTEKYTEIRDADASPFN